MVVYWAVGFLRFEIFGLRCAVLYQSTRDACDDISPGFTLTLVAAAKLPLTHHLPANTRLLAPSPST